MFLRFALEPGNFVCVEEMFSWDTLVFSIFLFLMKDTLLLFMPYERYFDTLLISFRHTMVPC